MKKKFYMLLIAIMMVLTFSGCQKFSISINTVGKDNTTIKKMTSAVEQNLKEENLSDYKIYAVEMSMDAEGVGKANMYLTNKLPQELQYSDIMVVTLDTRTGKIDSVGDADFSTKGTAPYEYIVDGAPLETEGWKKDSAEALSIAQNEFYGETDFTYNYSQVFAYVNEETPIYSITFISFVNHLKYSVMVDAMTGAVISKDIVQL